MAFDRRNGKKAALKWTAAIVSDRLDRSVANNSMIACAIR
jgi:hypothetical protein